MEDVKKIMLVDDHPLMQKGLSVTLNAEDDLEVAWVADSAEEALGSLHDHKPDLLITDISLPGMSGLELVKNVGAMYPDVKTLVVSRHDESLYAERAIRAGARGYIMKMEAGDVIVKAARRVLGGGIFVSEDINERLLLSMAAGKSFASNSPFDLLSDRELEVFELTGKGQTTRDIAERLHLSVKTVESYRARIKDKLQLHSAAELVQHAVQWVDSENRGR